MKRTWDEAIFRTAAGARYGSVWNGWGIAYAQGRRYVVYRLDGPRLTEFNRLRFARRFCEAIDGLTDWSRPTAELVADDNLDLAMHGIALKITGGRPDLRVVP